MSNSQVQALRIACYLMVAAIVLWLAHELKTVIISFILALMLAAAMTPVAEAWERKRIARPVTITVIYVAVALLYLFLGIALFPAIREQGKTLMANLPNDIENLARWYDHVLAFAGDKAALVTFSPADSKEFAMKAFGRTIDMTTGIFGLVLNSVLVLFLAGYFVINAKNLWKEIFRWIPGDMHERMSSLIEPLQDRLGGYVRGQILVASAVAIFFVACLSLLHVNYALTLGAVAGLLNIVPYIGSFAAACFAILVAFNQNPLLGLLVMILFAVEQWIESNFMVPILLGRQVEMHALAVLVAMIVGATLAGIAGAIVAIPIVSIAIYLGEEFYVKKIAPPPLGVVGMVVGDNAEKQEKNETSAGATEVSEIAGAQVS
ncbi:MAG: AI-2E family transporter [Cyanobacteria bacterium REEB67]|nr:AI-2E family transporter [Cyanobacteria bacterium REEB67]